jgi:hypothetical protein
MRREVLMRVVLAGMALLLIANLLSPWLVTPPPSYGAKSKVVEYKVSGIQGPDHPPTLTPKEAAQFEAMPINDSNILELPDDFWTRHPPREA